VQYEEQVIRIPNNTDSFVITEDDNESSSDDEDNDNDSSDGYDTLYNLDDNDSAGRKHQLKRKKSSGASVISKATKSKPSDVKGQ
jgi:hypothetical protein